MQSRTRDTIGVFAADPTGAALEEGYANRARDYLAALDRAGVLNAGLDEIFQRRDADHLPRRAGTGTRRPRLDRQRDLQRALDDVRHALRDRAAADCRDWLAHGRATDG